MRFFKKKKIFIHIGHGKTGTSSIQKFLLKESKCDSCNFFYPDTTRIADGHHLLFKSDERTLNTLFEEITSTDKNNIVISSESGLPNMRHFIESADYKVNFFKKVSRKFDAQIIYYVRNHFDILESSFLQHTKSNKPELYEKFLAGSSEYSHLSKQQLLKQHFFPKEVNPQSWIELAPTRQFNYYANLEDFWCKIFGEKNILSKVYDKNHLVNNDSVQDFIAFVDPSNMFLKNKSQQIYSENTTDIYTDKQAGYLLDEETRETIKAVFLESNLLFARDYLSKEEAGIFLEGFV